MPGMAVMGGIGASRCMIGMGRVSPVPGMIHACMMGVSTLREDHGVGRSRADTSRESQCAHECKCIRFHDWPPFSWICVFGRFGLYGSHVTR